MQAGSTEDEHSETRARYTAKVAATYDFRYGHDRPFAPSNMTTDTGQFIDPKDFPTAQYCGHCHQASHSQWRESAHSNSNRAPWYLKNVDLLNSTRGVEFSRHCEGCHDPIAVAAGALTPAGPKKRPYDQDGVTCMVCHSIQKVDVRGTGSYTLAVPAVLVDEAGAPIHRPVADAEILAHLDRHSAAVMKPFYRTSEFCASCHKAALPHELNSYKWQRAMSPYDEWQNSSFAKESPLPFYRKESISTCGTCHMTREALAGRDPGAKKGTLASHRWLGANSLLPEYYHFDEQARRIKDFLSAGMFNIDLFALEPEAGGAMAAPLGSTPFDLRPDERVVVSVVIQNKGAAHSHVPEQRDMYESWVEFTVRDAGGKVLAQSGALQPSGDLDPAAHSFTNRLINKEGALNDLHQVWNNRIVAYNNSIQSGRSQLVRYAFALPRNSPTVSVTASVRYRRFNQHFIDFGLKPGYTQPVMEMGSATQTLRVGHNARSLLQGPAAVEAKSLVPEWMRWNNYGIALLDAQQYVASVHAFGEVVRLRPDYADGYTNIAIARILWERYDEAEPDLQRSLELEHGNSRALYYLALVRRNRGDLPAAIEALEQVLARFPRSRDAHRELGFIYYQQHRLDLARAQYEAVQGIDPDDLAAHYNLAILYRRLGLKDKAAAEAASFADQKDDPTAAAYALNYLRGHGQVAQESVVWHVHDLDERGASKASVSITGDMLPSQQVP